MGKGKPRHKLGYAEPLKLEWYDLVIANLIRMKTQGNNIHKVCLFGPRIVIKRNIFGGVDIYGQELEMFESGFEPVSLTFPSIQEAIEFDYKSYDDSRCFYFS